MNLILASDSYKLTHYNQYPEGTETVYSYFESREGAQYPYTVFFGLQHILGALQDRVEVGDVLEAQNIARVHFGNKDIFNICGWMYIVDELQGRLPVRIKAVPEGSVIPTGNVMMTVENTDPNCWWLTNYIESLLTHVWYPSTVATLSRHTKELIAGHLRATADSMDGLDFMLHDFGYRGATTHDAAAIGGAAHLVNFKGTDTLPAMELAMSTYGADLNTLAFSVPATEHSVMTSLGPDGEMDIVRRVLQENPTGIVSVVADSYNIYDFVRTISRRNSIKYPIIDRDGVFVVRPDSTTREHPTPDLLTEWIVEELASGFGYTTNSKGFKVLDPHVRVLWGDGIDPHGIDKILSRLQLAQFSAENMVFGCGGALLQRGIDRDLQRFAFKCSAQQRNGEWHDVWKDPLDSTKKSKRGRLRLALSGRGPVTLGINEIPMFDVWQDNLLETVFENGRIVKTQSFDDIRRRAALTAP